MSNKNHYERLLQYKAQLDIAIQENNRIQQLAKGYVGIKPQSTAVEIVARVYCKFCNLYNKLCEVYDQMQQVQRREYVKKIIDAVTCRIIELKTSLEEIEVFEYTYYDNALKQMFMIPDDVQILCPFFYPFEIRREEIQYILDEIMSGNRLGDPTPTPSEILRREEERLEEEARIAEEKALELQRKLAMGEEFPEESTGIKQSPEQLEKNRKQKEFLQNVLEIQRMERARYVIFHKIQKANKDLNLYLDLAGLKKPKASEPERHRAADLIQKLYRRFMKLKREHIKDYQLRLKLEMIIPSFQPPSAKIQLEKVKEARRTFRKAYYKKWLDENIKQKSKILLFKEGSIMEDISVEIRSWLQDWWDKVQIFDEFPWVEEGGSILIVKGETFSIDEYLEWRKVEMKRLKLLENNPKTKEDIKAEKLKEKEEKKRLAFEAKDKERKRIKDYKKMRQSPDNDPGVYIPIGKTLEPVQEAWESYQTQWRNIDINDPTLDVMRGYIMNLVIENKYQEVNLELRAIIDEMMRLELKVLKAALKRDYESIKTKIPITKKRKRPKKEKPPKKDKTVPAKVFQRLVDAGIVMKYPRTTLEEYWGDRNYAAADQRAILWTPTFPPPNIGDVQEQIRIRCLLTLGATCPKMVRSQLLVGPRGSGKHTLAYAIATETNSILINLSPYHIYNKMPGNKGLRQMVHLVNKVSRIFQPTVVLVADVDKVFYKKVPKEEKAFDPTRISKALYKDIIRGLKPVDKVMVIGTASEPWLAKTNKMKKAFPFGILLPKSDYGSISYILTKVLMKYHGISRDFNVHGLAQVLRGYDINSIRKNIERVLNGKRIAELKYNPLEPIEIVESILQDENAICTDDYDYEFYKSWYHSYSSFGVKEDEYMFILQKQLEFKEKKEKNAKKKKPA
ncbi:ATPase family associated with various cellular activities (AAA) domain-containing protein [Phthorimaea operculella]|nr:ATPase family associated with various cellular activities (AAA) domain-containing protein [Phthorimaea operculella]